MAASGRIQVVISGPFILLLLLTGGFMAAGFWLYTHQPPLPKPRTPPYYVNRTLTAVRPCFQCVDTAGKLRQRAAWKIGRPVEIPAGEQWWFAPVEDPPTAITVDSVPMLAVHPPLDKGKPWDGFDDLRVLLVPFQDIDGRYAIDHPIPPPAPTPPDPPPPDNSVPTGTQPQQP